MTGRATDASNKCYDQLRKLLGNSQNNSTNFREDTAAGFVVGAGDLARDAVPAMHKLGLSPIFILHYDSGEMYNLLNEFLNINLVGVRTTGMAQRELDDLNAKGTQVVLGVSTIASTPPTTPREEYVYNISKLLLEQSYRSSDSPSEHLSLPDKRCLADMLNDPEALYMAKEAEQLGWNVQSIKSTSADSAPSVAAGDTEKESPYWWQFKQKVAVS